MGCDLIAWNLRCKAAGGSEADPPAIEYTNDFKDYRPGLPKDRLPGMGPLQGRRCSAAAHASPRETCTHSLLAETETETARKTS
jgi:hypothetical protein